MRSLILASGLVFVLATSACGDTSGSGGATGGSASNGGATGDGGGGGGPSTGGNGTGGEGPTCEAPPGTPGASNDLDVTMVTALARDDTDTPIDGFDLEFCGANLCLYATTNVIGQALFTNDSATQLDRPTVKPGDSLTYGKIGYPWDPTAASPFPVFFPTMEDSGDAITPGGSVSAAGVTLDVGADVILAFDLLTYDTEERQTFRAGSVPFEQVAAATGSPDFAMVYSLGPVDTLFCPGVTATFDNYANLPADADVEFWGQELSLEESFAGYGEWAKIADGKVSSDGTTITTVGDGLPVLLSVAIKEK